jgi:hypothetical protein
MRRSSLISIGSIAFAVLGACSGSEPPRAGAALMLPQAEGVELGMNWKELRAVRPRAIRDSYAVWESVDPATSNAYLFGRGEGMLRGQSTEGPLRAVVMDQVSGGIDSVSYSASIAEIVERWSRHAGTPVTQEHETDSQTVRISTWSHDGVKLILVSRDSRPGARSRLLRAIVADPHAELPVELVRGR